MALKEVTWAVSRLESRIRASNLAHAAIWGVLSFRHTTYTIMAPSRCHLRQRCLSLELPRPAKESWPQGKCGSPLAPSAAPQAEPVLCGKWASGCVQDGVSLSRRMLSATQPEKATRTVLNYPYPQLPQLVLGDGRQRHASKGTSDLKTSRQILGSSAYQRSSCSEKQATRRKN